MHPPQRSLTASSAAASGPQIEDTTQASDVVFTDDNEEETAPAVPSPTATAPVAANPTATAAVNEPTGTQSGTSPNTGTSVGQEKSRADILFVASKALHDYHRAGTLEAKERCLETFLVDGAPRKKKEGRKNSSKDAAHAAEEEDDESLNEPPTHTEAEETDTVENNNANLDSSLYMYRLKLVKHKLKNNDTAGAMRATHAIPPQDLSDGAKATITSLFPGPIEEVQVEASAIEAARIRGPKVSSEELKDYIDRKTKSRKADDIYGWELCDLQAVLKGNAKTKQAGHSPLLGLIDLINDVMNFRLTDNSLRMLKRYRGCPIPKSNGGVRPIAIEPMVMKIAGAILLQKCKDDVQKHLGKWEHGVGVKGSTETMAHLIRSKLATDGDNVVLSVDMTNAFNTIPRATVLREVRRHCPAMYPMAVAQLATPAVVEFRDRASNAPFTVNMREGVTQGSPLGGAFFSFGFASVLSQIESAHPDVILPRYYDDLYIIGHMDKVLSAFDDFKSRLLRGLSLNLSKTILFCSQDRHAAPGRAEALAREIKFETEGIVACGTPVGSEAYETRFVETRVDSVIADMSPIMEVAKLPESFTLAQMANRVLRLCFSSQLTHLIRSVPPRSTQAAMRRLDNSLYESFMQLIQYDRPSAATTIGTVVRERVLLPTTFGGTGHTCMETTVEAAFVASLNLVSQRITALTGISAARYATIVDSWGYTDACTKLREYDVPATNFSESSTLYEKSEPGLQKKYSSLVSSKRSNMILADLPLQELTDNFTDDQALQQWMRTSLLHTRDSPVSGAFLLANPKHSKYVMTDTEFTTAAKAYLGLPSEDTEDLRPRCPLGNCSSEQTAAPIHRYACGAMRGARTLRHSQLVNGYHHLFQSYSRLMKQAPKREPFCSVFFRASAQSPEVLRDYKNARFDEAVHIGDRRYILDYTIVSAPLVTRSAQAVGAPLDAAVLKKGNHYKRILGDQYASEVTILPFDTFARLSTHGLEFLRSAARGLTRTCENMYPLVLRDLIQSASVAIWKGNAGIIAAYDDAIRTYRNGRERNS
jgi:hypothetical protein